MFKVQMEKTCDIIPIYVATFIDKGIHFPPGGNPCLREVLQVDVDNFQRSGWGSFLFPWTWTDQKSSGLTYLVGQFFFVIFRWHPTYQAFVYPLNTILSLRPEKPTYITKNPET